MALYVKASGVWGATSAVWVKISSLWTKARQVYVRSSGVWEKMFPIDLLFNGTHEDSTATTVYTHTSIPLLVAPHANRRVIVTTETTDTESAVTVNSMTIGGCGCHPSRSGGKHLQFWCGLSVSVVGPRANRYDGNDRDHV